MNVRVYDADHDADVAFYGISDFEVHSDDSVTLHVPTTADHDLFPDDQRHINGHIKSAVDSGSFNRTGLQEAVQIDRDRDDEVVIVQSDTYPLEAVTDDEMENPFEEG